MNSPVRLGVSPAASSTPTGVFNQRFEALYTGAGALGVMVRFAPLPVPPGLSMSECGAAGAASGLTACPVLSTIHHLTGFAIRRLAVSPVLLAAHLLPSYRSG